MRLGSCLAVTATAPTGPLAWEPPCAVGVALKRPKKKKNHQKPDLLLFHQHQERTKQTPEQKEAKSLLQEGSQVTFPVSFSQG